MDQHFTHFLRIVYTTFEGFMSFARVLRFTCSTHDVKLHSAHPECASAPMKTLLKGRQKAHLACFKNLA